MNAGNHRDSERHGTARPGRLALPEAVRDPGGGRDDEGRQLRFLPGGRETIRRSVHMERSDDLA
jgi:hypothetical protein